MNQIVYGKTALLCKIQQSSLYVSQLRADTNMQGGGTLEFVIIQ